MLVNISSGILSIHVKSERYLAVGWNDILLNEKPIWLDEKEIIDPSGFHWIEDLIWKEYDSVNTAKNRTIKEITPIVNSNGLIGLDFSFIEGGNLLIYDDCDMILGIWKQ